MNRREAFLTGCLIAIAVLVAALSKPVQAQQPPASYGTFSCGLDNIGATLTKCSAAHPDALVATYITDIVASSTTATGGEFLLQYGTGTNCGTGTTSFFPSAASVVRFGYAANTASATVIPLRTPLRVPGGKDICALGIATQTLTIELRGFYGPL